MSSAPKFIFLGSKITADSDCSHEFKRHLLLGRKTMTDLDSILESRDITLPTKVCLVVTAMVFPVVMFGCENWTIKKAECWRADAFKLWCWRRLLRVSWIVRRSNQSILKEIGPEYSLEGLMLKCQSFGHLMWRKRQLIGKDPDDGKDRRQEEKGMTEDKMVGWHHRLNEQVPGDDEGQGSLACCSPWGHKESYTTEWLNNRYPQLGWWKDKNFMAERVQSFQLCLALCKPVDLCP